MPRRGPRDSAREQARRAIEARTAALARTVRSFLKLQFLAGVSLLLSSAFGTYLLATDRSLWILAVSHAYGLIAIVGINLQFGILNVLGVRRAYIFSVAGAQLGVLLQVGDILTAPTYGMTIAYFASYLFSLWAFDALLFCQILVISLGIVSRVHMQILKDDWRYRTAFSASRREFLKGMIGFAIVVAIAAGFSVLGETKQTTPGGGSGNNGGGTGNNGTGTGGGGGGSGSGGLPPGAVANVSQVQPGSPVYFEYPTGYPNILMRKSDGTIIALSLLCTHVCCQLTYQSGNQLYCDCHYSLFDENGNVVNGPANIPLPTITLTIDSNGNIFPQQVNGSSPCIQ